MGSSVEVENTGAALFSKAKRQLLALLFTHPERTFYLRQIIRVLAMGQGVVQRELSRLSGAGLVTRTRIGSQVHYQANRQSPLFNDLKSLMVKTVGVAEVLRDALASVAEQIQAAFIFGSLARGEERADSDVDILVVGKVAFGDVVVALQRAQKTIAREVNPAVFSAQEFRTKVRSKDRFVTAMLSSPRIFLIGGEHELKRLGYGAVAQGAKEQPSGNCQSAWGGGPKFT